MKAVTPSPSRSASQPNASEKAGSLRKASKHSALLTAAPARSTSGRIAPDKSTPDKSTPRESTSRTTRQRIRLETRAQLLERLTNPQISLHEASVILRVCPATVRNYCNAGYLPHDRTPGGQRRFRLNEVLAFAREREAERRK